MFGLAKRKPEELDELEQLAKDPAERYIRFSSFRPPNLLVLAFATCAIQFGLFFLDGPPLFQSFGITALMILMPLNFLSFIYRTTFLIMNSKIECHGIFSSFMADPSEASVSATNSSFQRGATVQKTDSLEEKITLRQLGKMQVLYPTGVLLLSELTERGARVDVPGFGGFEPFESSGTWTMDPLANDRLAASLTAAGLLIVWIVLSVTTNFVPRSSLGPLLLIFACVSIWAALEVGMKTLQAKENFLSRIEITSSEISVVRSWKEPLAIRFSDVRSIEVSVSYQELFFERVSVKVTTHYGRTYVLLNKGKALGCGFLHLLEAAKQKGINIRYLHLQAKVDEPRLALELNPISVGSSEGAFGNTRTHLDGPHMSKTTAELSEEI